MAIINKIEHKHETTITLEMLSQLVNLDKLLKKQRRGYMM